MHHERWKNIYVVFGILVNVSIKCGSPPLGEKKWIWLPFHFILRYPEQRDEVVLNLTICDRVLPCPKI